jgi:hypothetical protein
MSEKAPQPFSKAVQDRRDGRLHAANEEGGNIPVDPPSYDAPEVPRKPEPARSIATGSAADERRIGVELARSLRDGSYHPVVLFGTQNSGKTSLLLSMFAALEMDPQLKTGLVLCDPVLTSGDNVARQLHDNAKRLFDAGTLDFIAGVPTPRTVLDLPFFVPVEVRPEGKPIQRFAFLESSGEWYRPKKQLGQTHSDQEQVAPELQAAIEGFIANFAGPITFLYLAPYTQRRLDDPETTYYEGHEMESAQVALKAVLEAYNKIRQSYRLSDRHLLLVTKWDTRIAPDADRAETIQEDRETLLEFLHSRYPLAMTSFKKLGVDQQQQHVNAYVSGIVTRDGRVPLENEDEEVRAIVKGYPTKLWKYLYRNALEASDSHPIPLFPDPPKPSALMRGFQKVLDFVSGR